jgi:hypothetical protein
MLSGEELLSGYRQHLLAVSSGRCTTAPRCLGYLLKGTETNCKYPAHMTTASHWGLGFQHPNLVKAHKYSEYVLKCPLQ